MKANEKKEKKEEKIKYQAYHSSFSQVDENSYELLVVPAMLRKPTRKSIYTGIILVNYM